MFQCILIGDWLIRVSQERRPLLPHHVASIQGLITAWNECFVAEDTWIFKNHGVASWLVRCDCVPAGNSLFVYEIEERPGGVGACTLVSGLFRARLQEFLTHWQPVSVVKSQTANAPDDHLWLPLAIPGKAASPLVLVRSHPSERQYHYLSSQSVSTVRAKGNKSYGVPLKLWSVVRAGAEAGLPWERGFVLKPIDPLSGDQVLMWDPEMRVGGSRRDEVVRALARQGSMYLQELVIPPRLNGLYWLYRVFFGYNVPSKRWDYLGGIWQGRPTLKLYGTNDSVFGPVE